MILAGDIGGTKTVLALYSKQADNNLICIKEEAYLSQQSASFEQLLAQFIPADAHIDYACFGIAGPVVNETCQMTNLNWMVDGTKLQQQLGITHVKLLNDLEAMAIGMLNLPEDDLVELNPNAQPQTGNRAVIAAGTGLGEAILYWDGTHYHPIATEGGHTDFAPRNVQQDQLLAFLRKTYSNHVSSERILSGIGFSHLYDFLSEQGFAPSCPDVPATHSEIDRNAVISQLGVSGQDPLCSEVVRLFVEIYGAEAGNLALKSLSLGGIYLGGGIGPKILPTLKSGEFIKAFKDKGRYHSLLDSVSVKLAINQHTPLIGAAHYYASEI